MAAVEWRGAVEFAGFPVNVALHKPWKKTRTESFKMVQKDGSLPPKKDSGVKTYKGVEVEKGKYKALSEEAVELIQSGSKTKKIVPQHFAPIATVDLTKALATYEVTHDEKVEGSDGAANILWNGLMASKLALVSTFSKRGSMDAVIVFYADDKRLLAAEMPFEQELYPQPTAPFVPDEKAQELFKSYVDKSYDVKPAFDWSVFESEYKARRAEAIEKTLAGEEIVIEKTPEPEPTVDLMAILAAKVEEPVDA